MHRKPSMLVVFLTVFIDLIGFGIVVPLVPVFARRFEASGLMIGVILASFSAMQFVFSPIWGRLSDRHGRRPILLISTLGAAVSYVLFALGSSLTNHAAALTAILVARAFAGACGGNITVAQAYVADITPPENRSKRMGLIGMAFGLGFIFGPAIGGISLKDFHLNPGWVAAALCAANFVFAFFVLAESRKPDGTQVAGRPRLTQWQHTLAQPGIGLLVVVFFLSTVCFSCFESTLALLVCANFHLDINNDDTIATVATYLFVYCGLIAAVVQGGLIGRFVKMLGEPKVIALSLVLTAISLAMLPFIHGEGLLSWHILSQTAGHAWWWLLAALALLAFGSSLTRAPLFGLLSNLTSSHEQGATIGVAQSAGSLARIIGQGCAPMILFWSPMALFVSCGVIMLVTSFSVVSRLQGIKTVPATMPESAAN
jgi:MFS family permease